MDWEHFLEHTNSPNFFINLKINMASFVDLHKVVGRKSAFSALSSAQNKSENLKKN